MPELQALVFAQKFPFSSAAKSIVRSSGLALDALPEEVLHRAALLVSSAWKRKPYRVGEIRSREFLEFEIMAFPVAKIILSHIRDPVLNERFAQAIADNAFFYLEKEKRKGAIALELASDFGLHFSLAEKQGFFVSMGLTDFLKAKFSLPQLKLVNQPVEKGKIFLTENDFCRFVAQYAFSKILETLPVDLRGIPDFYRSIAQQIKSQLKSRELKAFEVKIGGKISIENFAPCMKDLYLQLLNGTNLPHMARFDLATFLVAVGMPEEQIDKLFSHAPNYNQKTTLYHVKRIARLKLSPPACKKVREHGYCPLQNCTEIHPLIFFERKAREAAKVQMEENLNNKSAK